MINWNNLLPSVFHAFSEVGSESDVQIENHEIEKKALAMREFFSPSSIGMQ